MTSGDSAAAAGRRPSCLVVGLGSWGRKLLPRVRSRFEVAAVVGNGGADSAAWCAEHHPDTPRINGMAAALSRHVVDAVFIATPTPTHAALAVQALEAGCHVFVEKPLALDERTAALVTCVAGQRGLEVFVGYVYLFHRAFSLLRSLAPPESIRGLQFEWIRPRLAGTLHGELLCHDLAVVIGLTDELPERVDVVRYDDRLLHCRIELPSGRMCETSIRRSDDTRKHSVTVHRDDGALYKWRGEHVGAVDNPSSNLLGTATEDALTREVAAFAAAIAGTGPRMADDQRFSVGIGRLLDEVGRSRPR